MTTPFNHFDVCCFRRLAVTRKKFRLRAKRRWTWRARRLRWSATGWRMANILESLDALAPQFIETIPHDIIGGQPLHYRRTEDGQFVLYSVGWNETDDGGRGG